MQSFAPRQYLWLPLLALFSWLHWGELMEAAIRPMELASEGRLKQALAEYPESLQQSSNTVDAALVRGYLQLRHLNQGSGKVSALACEEGKTNCLLARQLARHYDTPATVTGASRRPIRFHRGESGHAVVNLDTMDGRAAPMVLDTGSVATILPASLGDLVESRLSESRVSNLGRTVQLTLVRTAPFLVGNTRIGAWVSAVTERGFEREGVLGLDMLHALGGFHLDSASGAVQFLQGRCEQPGTTPLAVERGALVGMVDIDGKLHRALIDTGSVRSFVFSPTATNRVIRVGSDFGTASLRGVERDSTIRIAGFNRAARFIHVAQVDHFYPGTTAIIGMDVLMSGAGMGVCIEPMRLWLE